MGMNRHGSVKPDEGRTLDSFVTRTKASCIILGILLTLLGLAFFVNPVSATIFVTLCIGWAFLIGGVVTIITYFTNRTGNRTIADFVLGILEVILGILVLIWPATFALYLFIMIGCIIFITGIFDIVEAIAMPHEKGSMWGLWLVIGIITLIFGVLVFSSPWLFAEFVMIFAGVALVFDGITEIIVGVRL